MKEIKDCANFKEVIILSGSAPKYFMDLWVNSAYTAWARRSTTCFDINEIKICDLEQCLQHIDQYPMTHLSINLLETGLLEHFEKNKLYYDIGLASYARYIINKYQMKALYLYFHNEEYKNRYLR